MCDLDPQLLSAFHDEELDSAARQRVEAHLLTCSACASELRLMREASQLLATYTPADLNDRELGRLHEAIDETADRPILRIGGMLSAAAASLLIVSCAWLMDMPARHRANSATPPTATARVNAPAQPWEQLAITLRAETPIQAGDELTDTSHLADAKVAEWMLQGLASEANEGSTEQ
jgi:anti-sigma factor RsiW